MWNTPGRRWEKPLDDRMAMSSLGGWDSGDRPAVYCHIPMKCFLTACEDFKQQITFYIFSYLSALVGGSHVSGVRDSKK